MADAGKGFLGLLDMIDGGGMGQSGSKFEGGPLSGFLNALGVRPYGYMDRLSAVRPEMRPAGLGAAAPMRPQARPSLPMTGMDETLVPNHMSPLERFGGQPPSSGPMGGPGRSPTGPRSPKTGPAQVAADPMFGNDPGRVNEFARWVVDNYGINVADLPSDAAQRMYSNWLNQRTGYRF